MNHSIYDSYSYLLNTHYSAMKVIVTVVEQIISEAHIDIPDGLTQEAIKEEIVSCYNTGQMATDFNIAQVDFISISAQIITQNG